ncbi:hypothetical protein N3K66_005238 [Trichothecium roseum]|uniref:Uncharacterized protein n=1 Tax=Trichothecium roseum TaxID=47278 RepID=A0ACC0V5D2_9HYPO|nr:hypothetical protein N3K66_005238 [Trichothecium roseum]
MASSDSIVILGAGIIGLDVAYALVQRGLAPNITVVAEYMPGDTAANYTSPWAGCNFSAISGTDANALRWDKMGYAHLSRLAATPSSAAESFVESTPSTEYWDDAVPHDKIRHMSEYLKDFKIIPAGDLPPGIKFGVTFTAMTINAPKHIEFLRAALSASGVRFVRRKLPSLAAAYLSDDTRVVFNCAGIAAGTLAGVEDGKVFPTRGQIVLARAPDVREIVMLHGREHETYVIPRPGSGGNVVLGGYMQKGNGDSSTYAHETESILQRTRDLSPALRDSEHEVLAAFSGLRPSRIGGARIERAEVEVGGRRRVVVHNYGAGGTGFQAGWGMSVDAVGAVDDILEGIGGSKARM